MSHRDRKAPRMLVLQCDQTKRQSDTLKPSGTMSFGFSLYWSCTTAKRGTQYNSICNLSLTKVSIQKGETWAKTVSDLQAFFSLSLLWFNFKIFILWTLIGVSAKGQTDHFGPHWNISTNPKRIAVKFCPDIHGSHRIILRCHNSSLIHYIKKKNLLNVRNNKGKL